MRLLKMLIAAKPNRHLSY